MLGVILIVLIVLFLFGGLGAGHMGYHAYAGGGYDILWIVLVIILILFLVGRL
jgi:hypothetical protein